MNTSTLHLPKKTPITLCWLRRDLRLHDHHALHQALKNETNVLPLFIFDTEILDHLPAKKDARVHFIHTQLSSLHQTLQQYNTSLISLHGKPLTIFQKLTAQYNIQAVYTNEDHEPYATTRDTEIQYFLQTKNIPFHTFQDHIILHPSEGLKPNKKPYTVYTPYMKHWKKQFQPSMTQPFSTKPYTQNYLSISPLPLPSLTAIGFQPSEISIPSQKINPTLIQHYQNQRNDLTIQGTTHLGIHLRFGTLSIREVTRAALNYDDAWLQQLIWRNFFISILAHYPHVVTQAFKPAYDRISWEHDTKAFQAWCQGKTGFPIVDAGMRELNTTGLMHNRARMITASFLTKLLLIDWRLGEAYFGEKLLDYDLALNNGNWQWAAGTGCDAAPYFRIFSPERQTERFDPQHLYIKKWVPEYNTPEYPQPIIDYTFARKRALERYKKALDTYKP